MIHFAPSVYVLQYLDTTMLDDEEIRKRALGNMMEGEQLNWLLGVNSIIIRIFFGIICIKCMAFVHFRFRAISMCSIIAI